jgi:hypothetical protein
VLCTNGDSAQKRQSLVEGTLDFQAQFIEEVPPELLERHSETQRISHFPDHLTFWAFLGQVASDDASCAASSDCALLGRCTYNGAQKICVVFDDADCAQASVCTMDGACTAVMSCPPEDSACSLYGSCTP